MLPDFPKTKKLIKKNFDAFTKQKIKEYAEIPISDEQYNIIHEGDGMLINYTEGQSHDSQLKKVGGEYSMNIDDLMANPTLTFVKLDKLARTIAEQQGKILFDTVSEITEKFGQTSNRKGDPTAEDLLGMFEKMQFSFNSNGSPNIPTIYCAPEMVEKVQKAERELFETPEYRERFNQIINTKKQNWIDRENNRKLVD